MRQMLVPEQLRWRIFVVVLFWGIFGLLLGIILSVAIPFVADEVNYTSDAQRAYDYFSLGAITIICVGGPAYITWLQVTTPLRTTRS